MLRLGRLCPHRAKPPKLYTRPPTTLSHGFSKLASDDLGPLRFPPALHTLLSGQTRAGDALLRRGHWCDWNSTDFGLTFEQKRLGLSILQSPSALHAMWGPASSGKSSVMGWLLGVWNAGVDRLPAGAENLPLAVVVTRRNAHREGLCSNILRFAPAASVFIVESRPNADLDAVQQDRRGFLGAPVQEAKKHCHCGRASDTG